MKAITVWQPWASLLAIGAKKYETRSRTTSYRGPIAIHAAIKPMGSHTPLEVLRAKECLGFAFIKEDINTVQERAKFWYNPPKDLIQFLNDKLPLGAVVATAELVECWHIVHYPGANIDVAKNVEVGAELNVPKHHPRFNDTIIPSDQELLFGDWTPGRYAWELADVKVLPEPIPCGGKQGLWNWEPDKGALL